MLQATNMGLYYKYATQLLRVTTNAAAACYPWIGLGKEKEADNAAVQSMRETLDQVNFKAHIIIGEGERDQAPMLYIGETLGTGTENIDIAVDPLEGTTICASNGPKAITVLAATKAGDLLNAPDVYMQKLVVPKEVPASAVNLSNTPAQNIMVTVLKRERHQVLVDELYKCGVRVRLISDGDIMAVLDTALGSSNFINIYMGIGGAPEGVLAAAALKTLGGHMYGKLLYKTDAERLRAKAMGIEDLDHVYTLDEMVKGHAVFVATGVTDGDLLGGVSVENGVVHTSSMVLSSEEGKVEFVNTV
jgi:fructose-1,6-bisphosphatase class II